MSIKNFTILILSIIFLFGGSNVSAETFGWCEGGFLPAYSDPIGNLIAGTKFNLPDRAELQKITAPIDFSANGEIKAGIYDNADTLVAETLPHINISGDISQTYFDLTFSENPILASGNYWLVVWANNDNAVSLVKTQTTDGLYQKSAIYNGLPLSFTGATYIEERSSAICGTYQILSGDILTIPGNFLALTSAFIDDLFTDLSLVVIIAIGLPLGFWVIKKIIALV